MRVSVYLPLLLSVLVAAASRALPVRLAPARAAHAVAAAAALAAAASTWGLVLLAATLLGGSAPVSEQAAGRGVRLGEPVPAVVAVAAALALLVAVVRVVRVVRTRRGTGRQLRALCAACGAGTGELVVAALDQPDAFAVAGRPGRILVTRGMLQLLDADERRALLTHERAHLRGRHHLIRAIVEVAAAVNPVLIVSRDAVFLVERAADEDAVQSVGSREVPARALVAAALSGTAALSGRVGLAFHQLAVSRRVAALSAPPLPERRALAIGVASLGLLAIALASDATVAFARLVEVLSPI